MILLNRNLTDLAVAYQQICEFNQTLEQSWIPGFYRSYKRRHAAYIIAVHRYEERSRFTRMLFKRPKPPGNPPPGLQDEITGRLWEDWMASISDITNENDFAEEIINETVRSEYAQRNKTFDNMFDDEFFAITRLQTSFEKKPVTVVIGPSGAWIAHTKKDEKTKMDFTPLPDLARDYYPESLPAEVANTEQNHLDQLTIFKIIDGLLSHHQKICGDEPISALIEAERLMSQEKNNLIRLAATL